MVSDRHHHSHHHHQYQDEHHHHHASPSHHHPISPPPTSFLFFIIIIVVIIISSILQLAFVSLGLPLKSFTPLKLLDFFVPKYIYQLYTHLLILPEVMFRAVNPLGLTLRVFVRCWVRVQLRLAVAMAVDITSSCSSAIRTLNPNENKPLRAFELE